MHRFHLPSDDCHGETLTLAGAEAHHALRVLRVQDGARVTVLDGAGTILKSEMTAELEKEYGRGLENALNKGFEVLRKKRIVFLYVFILVKSIQSALQPFREFVGIIRIEFSFC